MSFVFDSNRVSLFEGKTFTEKINKQLVLKIINDPNIRANPLLEEHVLHLKKIVKKIKNNKLSVVYKRPFKYGRVYPKSVIKKNCADDVEFRKLNGISLITVKSLIKNTLTKDNYFDVDMVNCHYSLLYNICKKNRMNMKYLYDYVERREEIIQEICDKYNKTRKDVKTSFITILFSGKNYDSKNEFFNELCKEVNVVRDLVYNSNSVVVNDIKQFKEKKGLKEEDYDIKGTVLSYLLQDKEHSILEETYRFFYDRKLINSTNNCILCYDGIMIEKDNSINSSLLLELENYIKDKTGFDMKFCFKSLYDKVIDFDTEIISELDNSKLNKLDWKYFESLSSYDMKKKYMEHFLFFVRNPEPVYYFNEIPKDYNIHIHTEYSISKVFGGYGSGMFDEKNGKERKFIEVYKDDTDKRSYRETDFIPFNKDIEIPEDDDIFNTFNGFNDKINTPYKMDVSVVVKKWLDLLLEICGGDEYNRDFFLKFLSNMIKYPRNRPPICFILKGDQGVGKNLCLKPFEILLSKYCLSSSNSNDIFGSHGEGFYRKLLVILNEMEGKDTFNFEGKIKSFITEDTITVNPKNVRPFVVKNHSRTIITTNKPDPIPIDVRSGDRRYVVFKSTNVYKTKNSKFWSDLYNMFNSDIFISALYDYLMSVECENVNWINDRPLTREYLEMCAKYIPNEALFLEHFLNSKEFFEYSDVICADLKEEDYEKSIEEFFDNYVEIDNKTLYNKFNNFSDAYGMKYCEKKISLKKFVSNMIELQVDMVYENNAKRVKSWKFNIGNLYKSMVSRRYVLNDLSKECYNPETVFDEEEEFVELY